MEPPKARYIPLERRVRAEERKMALQHERLMRTRARKARRRPKEWGEDEKSNPDYAWRLFLKDAEEHIGRPLKLMEGIRVARFLRPGKKYRGSPEPLRRHELKKMRELIAEGMAASGKVPTVMTLRRLYKYVKGKTKKELWK